MDLGGLSLEGGALVLGSATFFNSVPRLYKMIGGFEELHYQLQLDGIKDMMGENSFLKVHSVVGELDIIIIAENFAVSDIDGDYHRMFS